MMILWPHEHKVLIRRLAGWAMAIQGTVSLGILLIGFRCPLLIEDEERVHLPKIGLTITNIRAITCNVEQESFTFRFSPSAMLPSKNWIKFWDFRLRIYSMRLFFNLPKEQFQQVFRKLRQEYRK